MAAGAGAAGTIARFVTINLWGDHAPLAARLDAAAAQLAACAPDVVLCQEVRRGDGLPCTGEALALRLAALTGAPWRAEFAPATSGPAGTWGAGSGAGHEGLAVLTPCALSGAQAIELPEARPSERRILLSARVAIGGAAVAVHTTHLHWRLRDGVARERQVVAVDAAARAYAADVVHVLGGDFNAAPEHDEIRFLRGEHGLEGRRAVWQDAWLRARPGGAAASDPGFTWSAANPHTAELAHLARDRRIDYLFVSPEERGGRGRVEAARVVLDRPDPTPGVLPSDHFAVLADVRIA